VPEPLTSKEVRRLFDYDFKTGLLMWRYRDDRDAQWNARYADEIAGVVDDSGTQTRIRIKLNKRQYMASRVVWAWVTGSWPQHDVRHRNRNQLDNRFENLFEECHADAPPLSPF